jgi:hypothetical protein
MHKILAVVGNHNFNENAVVLKAFFSSQFETLLIDSGSRDKHSAFDVCFPNIYYSGLWNEAVKLSLSRSAEWLLFCASDITIDEPNAVLKYVVEASCNPRIGIYTPSLDPASRAYFQECVFRGSNTLRSVKAIEGFFFLARLEILLPLYPIPSEINLIGNRVDQFACDISFRRGHLNVVDDRWKIFHPPSTRASSQEFNAEAERQADRHLLHLRKEGVIPSLEKKWRNRLIRFVKVPICRMWRLALFLCSKLSRSENGYQK